MEYTFTKERKKIGDGIFECVLTNIEPKTYNERTYRQLGFVVRPDIESNDKRYRNWWINVNINYGEYYDEKSEQRLNEIVNTQEYDGKSIVFGEEQLLQFLKGILCKIKVVTFPDKTTGETRQKLYFLKSDYKPSEVKLDTTPFVSDDDLPF